MRTAIALFGERVSPRFDCAEQFMIITTVDGKVVKKQTKKLSWLPLQKVKKLIDLHVETVICGGVDKYSNEFMKHKGIKVLADVKGQAEEVLYTFLKGKLACG